MLPITDNGTAQGGIGMGPPAVSESLSVAKWRVALARAIPQEEPLLEYLLLRDARAALTR